MHYYQHHIGDFVKATANLNDHQLVTYLRMMWSYYDTEEPFDADSCDRIAFAMRSDEKTVSLILGHYFVLSEGKWHHNRCDREIGQYKSKADKARLSANARWKNANALPSQSERNANEPVLDANQEPITKNQEPVKDIPEQARPVAAKPKAKTSKKTPPPEGFGISENVRKWAMANGHSHLEARLQHFMNSAHANAYRYADWDRAFMNAIQGDWAKLSGKPGQRAKPDDAGFLQAIGANEPWDDGMTIEMERGNGTF